MNYTPAKGIVDDLDISNEDDENGDPKIFSCKLGLWFWSSSHAVADFCIEVGELELDKAPIVNKF